MTNTSQLPDSINKTIASIIRSKAQSNIIIVPSISLYEPTMLQIAADLTISSSNTINLDISAKDYEGIDSIRALQKKLSLKSTNNSSRAIFVSNADLLSIEAQNCLLKTLEEPNEGCYFYLLTNNIDNLLKTVRSRCVISAIKCMALSETLEYFKLYSRSDATKAWTVSDGDYGVVKSLLEQPDSANAKCLVLAKAYISGNSLTKLKILYDLEHADFTL
jgi:hypothetical protein